MQLPALPSLLFLHAVMCLSQPPGAFKSADIAGRKRRRAGKGRGTEELKHNVRLPSGTTLVTRERKQLLAYNCSLRDHAPLRIFMTTRRCASQGRVSIPWPKYRTRMVLELYAAEEFIAHSLCSGGGSLHQAGRRITMSLQGGGGVKSDPTRPSPHPALFQKNICPHN